MMKSSKQIKIFRDRYPNIGPTIWVLCIQYFAIQVIVAMAWSHAYSLRFNTISDLGNTYCGQYSGRYVCSPLHNLMNASFIALGLLMVTGSMLIYQEFKKTKLSRLGFGFLLLAGIGTLLVGAFPENTIAALHTFGAFLPFLIGNLGIVILGITFKTPLSMRIYSLLTGIIALIALTLFATHDYLGLGIGGMERLTAYPQTLWLIVFGLYISRNHFKKSAPKS